MPLDWLTARPIAHRGFHDMNRTRWENTLPAFEAAAEKKYTIECDVRLSRDGIPIVFHDSTLERLAQRTDRIIDLYARDIADITVGDSTQPIITLETLLKTVGQRVPILVDLKGDSDELDVGLVTATCDLLRRYQIKGAIMSLDHHLLRRFPISGEGMPHGMVADGIQRRDIEAHFSMLAHNVQFIAFNTHKLTNPFVRFVGKALMMPILAWTVRSKTEWASALNYANQIIFEGFDPDRENHPFV